MYPVVFFDALRVKIRDDTIVQNKALYLALGVLRDGTRDVLPSGSNRPKAPSSGENSSTTCAAAASTPSRSPSSMT